MFFNTDKPDKALLFPKREKKTGDKSQPPVTDSGSKRANDKKTDKKNDKNSKRASRNSSA